MALPNPLKLVSNVVLAIPRAIASAAEEQRRKRELEEQRVSTPPSYDDGVSEQEFLDIIERVKSEFPRIKSATATGLVVELEIKSQSGITIWNATVDFNDFGHLTGWNKIRKENSDSKIPDAFAREVNEAIEECKAKNAEPVSNVTE